MLVSEELLDLDGQGAGRFRIPVVHRLGEVPASEADVLPHVETASPGNLDGTEVLDEPVDQRTPPGSVHRACADVHVGMAGRVGGCGAGPAPPVVVAVEVVDDEAPEGGPGPVEDPAQHGVEGIPAGQRPVDHLGGQRPAPQIEAPGVVGPPVHRPLAGPVEVDLEPGAVGHEPGREPHRPLRRPHILFPEPNRLRNQGLGRHLVPQGVSGVHRHRHHVAVGLLAGPERERLRHVHVIPVPVRGGGRTQPGSIDVNVGYSFAPGSPWLARTSAGSRGSSGVMCSDVPWGIGTDPLGQA